MFVTWQSWICIMSLPCTTTVSRHITFPLESESGCTVLTPSNIYLTWFYCEHAFAEAAHSTARRKYAPLKYVYLKCIFLYQVSPSQGLPGK